MDISPLSKESGCRGRKLKTSRTRGIGIHIPVHCVDNDDYDDNYDHDEMMIMMTMLIMMTMGTMGIDDYDDCGS